jgi:hypothetical protein
LVLLILQADYTIDVERAIILMHCIDRSAPYLLKFTMHK